VLVSELGCDFSKWPTAKHFTSWLGLCPNWQKTGGQVKSSATRQGKGRAARALRLAAWCLLRSKGALGAYLRRQRSRLGAPKTITRRMPSRCVSVWRSSCVGGRGSWASS
jgi:transposase